MQVPAPALYIREYLVHRRPARASVPTHAKRPRRQHLRAACAASPTYTQQESPVILCYGKENTSTRPISFAFSAFSSFSFSFASFSFARFVRHSSTSLSFFVCSTYQLVNKRSVPSLPSYKSTNLCQRPHSKVYTRIRDEVAEMQRIL